VLNVLRVHDVRQMEPSIPEPSLDEVEIAIGKLKSYKSPGTDQIPAELFKAWSETLYSEMHLFILHGIRRNFRSSGRILLLH
jgi:hypothetical protein